MKAKKSSSKNSSSFFSKLINALFWGVAVGAVILCICLSISSASVLRTSAEGVRVFLFAVISALVSAFAAGFITSKKIHKKGILFGALSAFVLASLLILISFIVSDFKITYHCAVILLTMCFGGSAGGIAAVNLSGK